MKIRTNCYNPQCLAKNSMIPIITKMFYSIKKEVQNFNTIQEKEYRTWKPLTLFYICKKCGFMSDFKSNDIRSGGIFWICLVPKDDEFKIDKIKSMKKPSCVYCGLSIFPHIPERWHQDFRARARLSAQRGSEGKRPPQRERDARWCAVGASLHNVVVSSSG